MAEANKPNIFAGNNVVSSTIPGSTNATNNRDQANSQTMASAAINNNSVTQSGSNGQKTSLTPSSLANVAEPPINSSNQQQSSVATFPQRPSEGASTANNGSPFGSSFSKMSVSEPNPPFQFNKQSSTVPSAAPSVNPTSTSASGYTSTNSSNENPTNFSFNPSQPSNAPSANPPPMDPPQFAFGNFSFNQSQAPNVSFSNPTSTNPPRFTFGNLPSANSRNASSNQPTSNPPPVQQPLPSFTFTPSVQKQQPSNNPPQTYSASKNSQQVFTTHDPSKATASNATIYSHRLSDPPTPTSEQSSGNNQEADTPASLADISLLAKKTNTKLREPTELVVDRSDPNSPLYSLTSFEELQLKPDLLKGIYNMEFQSPSKIQSIALPHLLGNPRKNIIAQSQSGTGKTAAFSLAIISQINPSVQGPQALILAPTFELAIQIGSVIENMARFLPYIKVAYAVRDPQMSKRHTRAKGQLLTESIVIGTPGTVEDWCGRLHVIDLSKLTMCCVDEADVMIATQGFQQNCVNVVKGLNIGNCQMMLFSATYSDEVMLFAREIIRDPVVLRLKREKQVLVNIQQYFVYCNDDQHKYHVVEHIYAQLNVGQAMIFCRTKRTANELAVRMAEQKHSVRELTGDLFIEQRAAIIQQFREGVFRVLISTNLAARGLDIDDVTLVINYDMPVTTEFKPDFETYLHRIGRCGRFGKAGYTFNLIGSEKDFNTMKEIETYFSHPIDEITMEGIAQLEELHD